MRATIASVCFAALAGLSITITWVAVARADAKVEASGQGIVTTNRQAASVARPDGSARVELPWLAPRDTGATVSPDGHRVAFSSARDGSAEIYVVETRSGIVSRLTDNPGSDDIDPAWSPDGRRLVWASGMPAAHDLFGMEADGTNKKRLVAGGADEIEPAWSPDAAQVAFASNRDGRYRLWTVAAAGGTEPTPVVEAPGQMRAPAWDPQGTHLAYTGVTRGNADVWVTSLDGSAPIRRTSTAGFDGRPSWSPDGRRIAFVSNRAGAQRIWLMRADGSHQQALAGSETGDDTPEWDIAEESILPVRGTLLPDLDQQAPSGIIVMHTAQQTKLGFTSAVDNIGDGPIHIRGTRSGSARIMRADQLIHHRNGTMTVVSRVGRLAYEPHPPHFHWHLEPYESYELRRASDGTLVGRDRKSGFCLLDRWGHAAPRAGIVARTPRYVGDCASGQPEARRVDEGSSVGYTDRYPGFFHGQDIDITGVGPGLYLLVHRANPLGLIRELRYSNDAASALIRISPADRFTGAPAATVVRRCPASAQCPAGGR